MDQIPSSNGDAHLAPVWQNRALARQNIGDVPYLNSPGPDDSETRGLIEYWRILRRRKGTLILIAFAGALAGFLFTLPQTPIYQAHTSLEIVGLNDNFLNIKTVNPVSQSGATSETSDIQTQIRILQSESLMERVVAKLKGDKPPDHIEQNRISVWRRALNLPTPPADNREQSLRKAAKTLKVRAVGQSRILEMTVDSADPGIAASFANTLAGEFIEQNLESRWQTTEHTSQWLTRQLDDMRVKLERSEDALQAYARQAGLMFTSEKTNVSEEKLKQVQQEISTVQNERISRQSRYEMAVNSSPEALPDILNDPGLRDIQTKLTELRRQIAELTATYTAEHPRVKRVQAQLATLQNAYERDRGAILKRIKNEYEEALRKEKLLAGAYAEQSKLVTGESEKAIRYNILKREVDSNRSLYDTMLQQLKQSTIAAAMRASNARVMDPAQLPGKPYKPDASASSGVGLLVSILLGAALIIMRERADRSIQQPGDTPFFLNIPELGIIPSSAADSSSRRAVGHLKHRSNGSRAIATRTASVVPGAESETNLAKLPRAIQGTIARIGTPTEERANGQLGTSGHPVTNGQSGTVNSVPTRHTSLSIDITALPPSTLKDRVELVTWKRKPSMLAEAFRSALISILFAGENGSRPRVLVLTSSSASEGKSTVVSNLGIAIAEIGQKVLIIDADMRKPRIHEIFGMSNESGLSEILRKRASLNVDKTLGGVIRETEIPGLYVLPSGASTSAATNLLYGDYMPELLNYLRDEFETILIDTPPMLQIPDARVLGRIADRVILVVRAGKTTRDAAVAARQRFSEDGTKLLGTILNDWNPKLSPYGYYGYYGYYMDASKNNHPRRL